MNLWLTNIGVWVKWMQDGLINQGEPFIRDVRLVMSRIRVIGARKQRGYGNKCNRPLISVNGNSCMDIPNGFSLRATVSNLFAGLLAIKRQGVQDPRSASVSAESRHLYFT